MKRNLLLLGTLLILLFISAVCITHKAQSTGTIYEAQSERTATTKDEKALDFTLKDLGGENVSLRDFIGKKPVLLDFSTTLCPYCTQILPTFRTICDNYNKHGLKIVLVYINEDKETVAAHVKKHDISCTVLLDPDGLVASRYKVMGVPTIVVIDKEGMIRYKGYSFPAAVVEQVINE